MTTIIVPIRGFLKNKIKRLLNLAKVAKERTLDFSNLEEVGGSVIAIDTTERKLLYLKNGHHASSCLIANLNNIQKCTVKKQYCSINAGDLDKRKISHFLKSILLTLRFKNNSSSVTLSLYEAQKDAEVDIEQVEAKARKWEAIVSKLLPVHTLERA